MRDWAIRACVLLLLGCGAAPAPAPVKPLASAEREVAASAQLDAPAPCLRIVGIEVVKSERLLRAHCGGGSSVEMTVALGRESLGDKREAGDLRTPEGRYSISGPASPSRFHAFVPIDYPSIEDADRALSEERIGSHDHARIVEAHERGLEPPNDTPLGGEIGLHGEGPRWAGDSLHLDWTFGCIAVSDHDLDFLIARIEPGIPVEIRP